jgi:phosphatidylglycerol:prolipoprotein diacylglycerol transferase
MIIEAKKNNISKDIISDLFFYAVIIGLIGARIYYVLFNFNYYINNISSIFKVWEGGLAIHGGLIAGLVFLYFYTKKKNLNLIKILDMAVVSVILGQAIGRWGNFMNGEAFGPITSLESLTRFHLPNFIIKGMYIDGNYHVPTFLLESLWCFIGFCIMFLLRKYKNIKPGFLTGFYLIWYGIERFLVETLRTDSLMLFNIKVAQLVSIVMILFGIIILYRIKKSSQ